MVGLEIYNVSFGFRVSDFGFRVSDFEFRVSGSERHRRSYRQVQQFSISAIDFRLLTLDFRPLVNVCRPETVDLRFLSFVFVLKKECKDTDFHLKLNWDGYVIIV